MCACKWCGDQAQGSGSVEVTENNRQDQVDGVSDKWRTGVKKTVRFGGASGIPEKKNDVESKEEKVVATLSLSVQVPAGDVGVLGENGRNGKSSMSQCWRSCDERLMFSRIRRSRTRCPTTMV